MANFPANIFSQENVLTVIPVILAIAVTAIRWFSSGRDIQRSERKIDEAEKSIKNQENKTLPAWELGRATLDAYFKRNLSQITSIYILSVIVLFIGLGIIFWAILQAINNPRELGPAAIAAIAGAITEFIGATFLFLFRSAINQAVTYAKTLERINSVGMAMQILDTMPDEPNQTDLKSQTKAKLVQMLVQQAYVNTEEDKST